MKRFRSSLPTHRIGAIARLGVPLLAGNLSIYLYRLADSIMVGRLGVEALAAIAVATVYTAVHEMLIWPVALGTQAITSRRFGHDANPCSPAIRSMVPNAVTAGLLGGAAAALLSLAAPVIVPFVAGHTTDATGTPAVAALEYVRISRLAFPIMGIASAMRGYLSAIGRTRTIMASTILSNVVNVAVNAVFIFGYFGIASRGVAGAAIGTVAAHTLHALILSVSVLRNVTGCADAHPIRTAYDRTVVRRILAIGAPVAIQNAFAMSSILIYQSIVGRLGAQYQAVTFVLFSLFRLNKALVGGFAHGASILVGHALGRSEPEAARAIVRSQGVIGAAIGLTVAFVVVSVPSFIAAVFSLEGAPGELLRSGLHFFALFFFVEVLAYSIEIIFTHNGYGRYVLMSEFSMNMIAIIGASFVVVRVFGGGIYGAWGAFAAYQVGHALILGVGLRRGAWLTVPVERPLGVAP